MHYKVIETVDKEHEIPIYKYEYESLADAERYFDVIRWNGLLIKVENGQETIIKSK